MPLPKIEISGNLVDAPELRFTPSGAAVVKFRVACSERIQDRQSGEWKDGDSCFLTVEVWRQQAENIAESDLVKGDHVLVTGRLRQRNYETREGEKRTVYEVKGEEVAVVLVRQTAKPQKASAGAGGGRAAGNDAWAAAPAPAAAAAGGTFDNEPPF